jgi:biopolymer transport protein ExbD
MPSAHGNEVNVTPLIDVVMCLIIFFMLVAKIGVAQGIKKMDLPYTYLGKKIEDMGNTLTLNVLQVGSDTERPMVSALVPVKVEGTGTERLEDRELPVDTIIGGATQYPLRETLRQMKGRFKDQFKVIIRADWELPFTLVEPVLIECSNAGAQNIFFATKQGNEPEAAGATGATKTE